MRNKWFLPSLGNYIIQYKANDGFRDALPRLLTSNHLLITSTARIKHEFKKSGVRCITKRGLTKMLENKMPRENCIVLDIRIPRMESKAFRALWRLVPDKNVVMLHSPFEDVESANTLLTLLTRTKHTTLNISKWSKYLYTRGYY